MAETFYLFFKQHFKIRVPFIEYLEKYGNINKNTFLGGDTLFKPIPTTLSQLRLFGRHEARAHVDALCTCQLIFLSCREVTHSDMLKWCTAKVEFRFLVVYVCTKDEHIVSTYTLHMYACVCHCSKVYIDSKSVKRL